MSSSNIVKPVIDYLLISDNKNNYITIDVTHNYNQVKNILFFYPCRANINIYTAMIHDGRIVEKRATCKTTTKTALCGQKDINTDDCPSASAFPVRPEVCFYRDGQTYNIILFIRIYFLYDCAAVACGGITATGSARQEVSGTRRCFTVLFLQPVRV